MLSINSNHLCLIEKELFHLHPKVHADLLARCYLVERKGGLMRFNSGTCLLHTSLQIGYFDATRRLLSHTKYGKVSLYESGRLN